MSEITIKPIPIPAADMIPPEPAKKAIIPLNGKLITSENPMVIGKSNFRTMTNMRYGNASPKSISGMTKINSTPGTYLKARNAFHYTKPGITSRESHVLAQMYNTGLTASHVLALTTSPPGTGEFSTDHWTDSAGASIGRFSNAPAQSMAYCNEVDTCVWSGNEAKVSRCLNFDPDGTFLYDYTDVVNNTSDATTDVMTFDTIGDGIDSSVMLLLSLDNNVTDTSPTTPHTVTNNNVTFTTSPAVFSYSGAFNGTDAYLTIPANADFDLSGGTWTLDMRARFDDFAAAHPLYYQKTDVKKFTFDTGSHQPTIGQTLYGETSGAVIKVLYVDPPSGTWGGALTGTIYYQITSGNIANGEHVHEAAGGAGNLVCNTTSAETDAGDNYIDITVNTSGYVNIKIHESYATPADIVDITCGTALSADTWYHLEVGVDGTDWYIFIDGQLKSKTSYGDAPELYQSVVQIGYDNTTYAKCWLDEYRLSNTCRHTANFTIPASAYSTATVVAHVYIGSPRPIQGVNWYVKTANTSAATATGNEWTGSAWSALSVTDGTASGGATLAQTGSTTFSSTVSTSKMKYIDGVPLYYYWFSFAGIDATTSIYYVTIDMPFQAIVDLWDGVERTIGACYKYTTSYLDVTSNVYEDEYDVSDSSTYMDLSSMSYYTSGQNFLEIGLFEIPTAISFSLPADHVQTTANTVCSVDYWSGDSYTSVGVIDDGTSEGGISMAKSGTVSWNVANRSLWFKKTIANKTTPLYYLRVRWDKAMDASVKVYYVSAIPAQNDIYGYKFPILSQDSLMLCGDMNCDKNAILVSAPDTCQVFNGEGSTKIFFGGADELTCGCTVFSTYGSSLYNITLIYKDQELWGLLNSSSGWARYKIADIGCAAPLTLDTVVVPPQEGQQAANRSFAIWVTSTGVYTSDGRHPIDVSDDIRDLFDQNSATHINLSYIKNFSGKVDPAKMEYHMFIAVTTGTVTTLDQEWVLDLRRWKWFYVDRSTGGDLQCAVNVTDAYGASHSYGFIDTGYCERLEYGTTFDGASIVSTLQTGDFAPGDDPLVETSIDVIVPIMAAKTTTTADVTMTHYIDTATSGTSYTADPTSSGYGLSFPVKIMNSAPGILHSVKLTITTTDETVGFEPMALGIYYYPIREHDYV